MAHITKKACMVLAVVVVLVGVTVPFGIVGAASIEDLVARVQALSRQLDALKRQVEATVGSIPAGIQYGASNSGAVRNLQRLLIDQGYLDAGLATGNFFTATRNAVRRFQYANGLPVTGRVDEKTREVVNALLQKKNEASGKTLIVKVATTTPLIATTSDQTITATGTRPKHQLDPRPAYDLLAIERATFDAVNGERQKNGLAALQWNDQLAVVARAHSADQAGDNTVITDPSVGCLYPFIRHEGFVTGFKVGDRLAYAGVQYRLAGENIIILPMTKELIYQAAEAAPACAPTPETEGIPGETAEAARVRIEGIIKERVALMTGQEKIHWVNKEWKSVVEIANESALDWMNSPGHRHNILTPEFAEGAIGAAVVNDYIIMTQIFLEKWY